MGGGSWSETHVLTMLDDLVCGKTIIFDCTGCEDWSRTPVHMCAEPNEEGGFRAAARSGRSEDEEEAEEPEKPRAAVADDARESGEAEAAEEAQPPPLNGGGGGIAARRPGAKMIAPGTPFYPLFPSYPASQS